MNRQELKYKFSYIKSCNMCGSPTENHKVLGKRLNQAQGKNPRRKIGITTTVVKCSNCGLIYTNPQPIPFDLLDHYGVLPENYWLKEYFVIDDNYFKDALITLGKITDLKKGMTSLDVGAGIGKGMVALSNAGFDAYGLEPSPQFYERAIKQMGISPDKLKIGMIEDVEYPENFFDFITFGTVLEHVYDPSDSIRKALQWVKPKGIIHIEVPSSDWLISKISNLYFKLIGTDYVGNLSPMHAPYHLHEFSLNSFKEHSKQHGYDVTLHEFYVCETYMPKFTDYFLKPYMKWTGKGMQLAVYLQKR